MSKDIILDLDHCLIFVSYSEIKGLHLISRSGFYYLYFRPDLDLFLRFLEKMDMRIHFYTSSKKEYATWVIKNLELSKDYPLFSRSSTRKKHSEFGEQYFKSLRFLNVRFDEDVLVLDDRPDLWDSEGVSFIDINPWHGEKNDKALSQIMIRMMKDRPKIS